MLARLKSRWLGRGLAARFFITGFPVLIAFVLAISWWAGRNVEEEVIETFASDSVLFLRGFLAAELNPGGPGPVLDDGKVRDIAGRLAATPFGKRLHTVKLWEPGGELAFHNRQPALIGRRFEPTPEQSRAWQGHSVAKLRRPGKTPPPADDETKAKPRGAFLEVYAPHYEAGSDKIIAVVAFYLTDEALMTRLAAEKREILIVVGFGAAIMFFLLLAVVGRGGRIIRHQREELRSQVAQLRTLLSQNERLSIRLRQAGGRATEINERLLRQLSADLHDGPAQSMSLALLRLGTLDEPKFRDTTGRGLTGMRDEVMGEVRRALTGALTEIRQISGGLALPELDALSARDVLQRVVTTHRKRTGSLVELRVEGEHQVAEMATSLKLTLYRLIQEALMNAHRHAPGAIPTVTAHLGPDDVKVTIEDDGPGFDPKIAVHTDRLGLPGLRERIEAVGGRFQLISSEGCGTEVRASIPLRTES